MQIGVTAFTATLIDVIVVFLFTTPMVTLLAGTKFYGGGREWSGLDPLRLGALAPWRSSTGRTREPGPPATSRRRIPRYKWNL
jgi:preprotein translocase subunit SecD